MNKPPDPLALDDRLDGVDQCLMPDGLNEHERRELDRLIAKVLLPTLTPREREIALTVYRTMRDRADEETKAGDLHRDLNRRTAEALGKPSEGDNSSWHDIPDQVRDLKRKADLLAEWLRESRSWVAQLRQENETHQRNLAELKRQRDELQKDAARERNLGMLTAADIADHFDSFVADRIRDRAKTLNT